MPRITKVYTRTGDDGTTGLGNNQRVPKDSLRIEACGTVDELNSVIGTAVAFDLDGFLKKSLTVIQNELFHLGSDLCVSEKDKKQYKIPQIENKHVQALEKLIDKMSKKLKPLENFVLPGGTKGAALLHSARTVCRRAERVVIALSRKEPIGHYTIQYLNRLSDTLFVMSRYENKKKHRPEPLWNSRI